MKDNREKYMETVKDPCSRMAHMIYFKGPGPFSVHEMAEAIRPEFNSAVASLESRHRDLVAAARKLFDLPAKTDDTKTALALLDLREALKDESNPPGEAPK